jgi:hypothetical protein
MKADNYPQPRRPPPKPKKASLWSDLTKDYKTGHYVFKDVARLLTLIAGVSIVVWAAWADWKAGRPISLEGAGILLTYALGVGLQKTFENQENRKTADANGNPLAVPGTADPPAAPEIMPQPNGTTSA